MKLNFDDFLEARLEHKTNMQDHNPHKRKKQQVIIKNQDEDFLCSCFLWMSGLKSLQSSVYESWSSTPILHLTLTGTFVFAAITDMASATNFPCISYAYIRGTLQINNVFDVSRKQIWTFGSSMRRTPKHPCPATFGLGHPQLIDNRGEASVMGLNKRWETYMVHGKSRTNLRLISS